MIEAMEQKIINSINNRWTKNKDLRREIDTENISESFRVICSSRAKTLDIIERIKRGNTSKEIVNELNDNMLTIYNWITQEAIHSILEKYQGELKDKKKEAEYKAEIPTIISYLQDLELSLIRITKKKLYAFHNITTEI